MATRRAGSSLEAVPGGEQAVADLVAQRIARCRAIDGDDRDAVGTGIEQYGVIISLAGPKPETPLLDFVARSSLPKIGWAMAIRRRVRSASVWPFSSAAPNSVTITSTSLRAVVTGPDSAAVMRLIVAALGRRRQRDDASDRLASGAGADEVHLAAGAAEIGCAALLGVDLAGQVDFDRRVDRHQLRQAAPAPAASWV